MDLPFKLSKFIFCALLLINSILCDTYYPVNRFAHSSVKIDNRLFILGGNTGEITSKSYELFYLDLSIPFNNTNLPWKLVDGGDLPEYIYSSTAVSDKFTIYLIGGSIKNQFYIYNIYNTTWDTPGTGIRSIFPNRRNMDGVIDEKGNIYLFGGYNVTDITKEMYLFNTVAMTFTSIVTSGDVPLQCAEYTANLLSSGAIIYIGGVEKLNESASLTFVNMNKIKLFDTYKSKWTNFTATGEDVDSRQYHTSILTPNGYIIIFGGCKLDNTSVSPNIAMLHTNTYEWTIPSNSEENSPPSIWGHTANLHSDYMIITFGFDIDAQLYNQKVYLFNITSNKWVASFNPSVIDNPTPKSKALVIGLATGGAVIALILIVAFVIVIYKKRETILRISGNNT
ncbi:hypothetical protein Glove_441g77 [Diversispora epigaea]|uniref:Attractin/MKLN-like beta-propeller domain-containing protein n=1 Tax=Diversispora epigaea TaxID=1348612 RepID=A0A397GSD5_9GLOM|nr:hypothetical protein Glove_441g77 [Diversispora epigaea]